MSEVFGHRHGVARGKGGAATIPIDLPMALDRHQAPKGSDGALCFSALSSELRVS